MTTHKVGYIGEAVKLARHLKGLSRDEFAKILELSTQSVAKFEQKRTGLQFATLTRLSQILDATIRVTWSRGSVSIEVIEDDQPLPGGPE